MTDPIAFDASSPRFGMPLLFAGQAQKEFYVNEAHALVDALLHPAVEGTLNAPPANPVDGQAWLVGTAPSGGWTGHGGALASWQGGNWLFTRPVDGMRVFDRAKGLDMLYFAGWKQPAAPAAPTGGTTIDAEARVAILQLISALCIAGIFPAS